MQKLGTILNKFSDLSDGNLMLSAMRGLYDRLSCQMLFNSQAVITATAGTKVPKTGAAVSHGILKGVPFTIAAGTDFCAMSGTVTADMFNVFVFWVSSLAAPVIAANMGSAMGIEGATLAAVKFPPIPEGVTVLGYVIINPTGTGDFVANTTALGDATVAPGALYISPVGPFDPTALI